MRSWKNFVMLSLIVIVINVSCQTLKTDGLVLIKRPGLPKFMLQEKWGDGLTCPCDTICLNDQQHIELMRFLIEVDFAFKKYEVQIEN